MSAIEDLQMAHLPPIPDIGVPMLYTDSRGRSRELAVRRGAHGSLLVLDRDRVTLCDTRLVAHIPSDEPPENATLVCRMYMRERGARRCRRLRPEDLLSHPLPVPANAAVALGEPIVELGEPTAELREDEVRGGQPPRPILHGGVLYAIRSHRGGCGAGPAQLRWSARPTAPGAWWRAITLRAALAALESYEPVCSLTVAALSGATADGGLEGPAEGSVVVLRRELERVQESALVLNRGLREAVLAALGRGELSLSEIALRCGMVKRDRSGRASGDTTWLARRIGLVPECGRRAPTHWVHSDVLARIARCGLGVSPREVELE